MAKRDELIAALFDTMDVARRNMHNHMQLLLSGSTITRPQFELLYTVRHMQPVSSKELAAKLRLTPGAISQLLDGLDQQHMIERQVDLQDRRRQTLQVSKDGLALLKLMDKKRRIIMENVISDLSDEDLAVWLRIQQKLTNEFATLHTTKERNDS